MKAVKISIQSILTVVLVLILAATIVVTRQQSASGNSITTKCSPKAERWICENFEAQTPEALLVDINNFIGNQTYVSKKPTDIFQYFDMDDFILDPNNLCFGWSCATSCIVKTIAARHPEWGNVTSLVVDAVSIYDDDIYHSFNFIIVDDENGKRTYYLDTTLDNTKKKNGEKVLGPIDISNYSIEDFSKRYCGYKIIEYH